MCLHGLLHSVKAIKSSSNNSCSALLKMLQRESTVGYISQYFSCLLHLGLLAGSGLTFLAFPGVLH